MSGKGSSRWRRIFRRDPRAEVSEELEFHLEQRVRDYMAQGMSEDAARAAAAARLGDLAGVRNECAELLAAEQRDAERHERLRISWLDFKLGFRMLVKYPGLTVVGGLAMAFAIWVGGGAFEFIRQVLNPALPLDDGARVVGIVNWDAAASAAERRALFDFAVWREELTTVRDLGVFRTLERNLVDAEHGSAPVELAEISASAFDVARVQPLLGRPLQRADESASAAPVAVIGYDMWRTRFGGDADIIGRSVQLGSEHTTVVGVMPEGFAFPVAQSMWVPFRLEPTGSAPREGPPIRVFGRLADGASFERARSEIATVAARLAADHPDTHAQLRPRVLPYAKSIVDVSTSDSVFLMSVNFFLVVLLVLVCANVALLMFARAATRESEMVVRSALGASRGRIVLQLFAEALVLGACAAVVGLVGIDLGSKWFFGAVTTIFFEGFRPPFWIRPGLSSATIVYVVALTVIGAGVAGVLPALKVTRGLQAGLREASTGLTFGGVWTAIIVTQVAVTFTLPLAALFTRRDAVRVENAVMGYPEQHYLTARIEVDREADPRLSPEASQADFDARLAALYGQLEQRLLAESVVSAVTFAERLPRMYHPARLIEMDAGGAAPLHPDWPAYRVSSARVPPDFFDVLQVPLVAGRRFHPGDIGSGHDVVIVNREFVDRVLGGRNPLGRQIRYVHLEERVLSDEARGNEPWYEIIGVVGNLRTTYSFADPKVAAIYHPAAPGDAYPLNLAIRTNGDPASFAPRLRVIAAAVDPAVRVYDAMPVEELSTGEIQFHAFWVRLTTVVSLIALTLSLAGIYAVMSFTVARRTREIGIRVALGSDPIRVVGAIFRRPLLQVTLGVMSGGVLVTALLLAAGGRLALRHYALLGGYSLLLLAVCGLACVVPARRALRVQPMEAMRADA